jgi:hypothetical protein
MRESFGRIESFKTKTNVVLKFPQTVIFEPLDHRELSAAEFFW